MSSSNTANPAPVVRVIGGRASPFVTRVFVALQLKGVEYEFLQEELGRKSELLLKSNPVLKKIPVLLHQDKPICESMIIIQYIDDVWGSDGPTILPSDPYSRATERFWADYADAKFPIAIRTLRGITGGSKDEATEEIATTLEHLEEAFGECSHEKHYFGGDCISFLDIVLGSYIGWFKAMEKIAGVKVLDGARFPKLMEWADRFCAHEAVKDVMLDGDKLAEFNTRDVAMRKANASNSK